MDDTTRPNILTIGVLAGAIAQMVLFIWNAAVPKFPMGAAEGAAVATILTALAQWADRNSKRSRHHVLNKHGPAEVREALRDDAA